MNENSSHDIYPYCGVFLSDKTIKAFETRTPDLIYQFNTSVGGGNYIRDYALVKFLGFSCATKDVSEAIQVLCSKLNELAEKDYIIATLAPMIVLPYYKFNTEAPWNDACAVMSYSAITREGSEYIYNHMKYLDTVEGGIPALLSDFKERAKE